MNLRDPPGEFSDSPAAALSERLFENQHSALTSGRPANQPAEPTILTVMIRSPLRQLTGRLRSPEPANKSIYHRSLGARESGNFARAIAPHPAARRAFSSPGAPASGRPGLAFFMNICRPELASCWPILMDESKFNHRLSSCSGLDPAGAARSSKLDPAAAAAQRQRKLDFQELLQRPSSAELAQLWARSFASVVGGQRERSMFTRSAGRKSSQRRRPAASQSGSSLLYRAQ